MDELLNGDHILLFLQQNMQSKFLEEVKVNYSSVFAEDILAK